jgi:hypothetical protein
LAGTGLGNDRIKQVVLFSQETEDIFRTLQTLKVVEQTDTRIRAEAKKLPIGHYTLGYRRRRSDRTFIPVTNIDVTADLSQWKSGVPVLLFVPWSEEDITGVPPLIPDIPGVNITREDLTREGPILRELRTTIKGLVMNALPSRGFSPLPYPESYPKPDIPYSGPINDKSVLAQVATVLAETGTSAIMRYTFGVELAKRMRTLVETDFVVVDEPLVITSSVTLFDSGGRILYTQSEYQRRKAKTGSALSTGIEKSARLGGYYTSTYSPVTFLESKAAFLTRVVAESLSGCPTLKSPTAAR